MDWVNTGNYILFSYDPIVLLFYIPKTAFLLDLCSMALHPS